MVCRTCHWRLSVIFQYIMTFVGLILGHNLDAWSYLLTFLSALSIWEYLVLMQFHPLKQRTAGSRSSQSLLTLLIQLFILFVYFHYILFSAGKMISITVYFFAVWDTSCCTSCCCLFFSSVHSPHTHHALVRWLQPTSTQPPKQTGENKKE